MFLESDIIKLEKLHQDINNRTKNSISDLIVLWETLPKEIWHYYNNTENGFDSKTWTSILLILKLWNRNKDNY